METEFVLPVKFVMSLNPSTFHPLNNY